ncbi:hypothetical protein AGMMS49938_03860 [Fibrobacterales bacterium]|nr:hypothetical protein AGMMS49938_03860 [Fibrobacterales bacterium]
MTVEELRQIFVERDAKYVREQAERDAKTDARFAKTDAQIRSLGERMDATNRRLDDNNRRLDDNNRRLDDNNRRLDDNNRRLDDNNRRLDENNRKLDDNTFEMKRLTRKVGKLVESIVAPGIVEKFNEKGFHFDSVSAEVVLSDDYNIDLNLAEIDTLLENGKFVIAVESKTELHKKDIDKHVLRMELMRTLSRFKGKNIYGAFSFAVAKESHIDYALRQGFYVLKQPDIVGTEIMEFPEGCKAKAW